MASRNPDHKEVNFLRGWTPRYWGPLALRKHTRRSAWRTRRPTTPSPMCTHAKPIGSCKAQGGQGQISKGSSHKLSRLGYIAYPRLREVCSFPHHQESQALLAKGQGQGSNKCQAAALLLSLAPKGGLSPHGVSFGCQCEDKRTGVTPRLSAWMRLVSSWVICTNKPEMGSVPPPQMV